MAEPLSRQPQRRATFLLLLLGAAVAATCFAALAIAVRYPHTQAVDEWALRSLRRADDAARPIGPAWVAPAAKTVTALGSLVGLVVATVGAEFLLKRCPTLSPSDVRRGTFLLLVAFLGSLILSEGTKRAFDRPRPTAVPHLELVPPHSFPSGHAMLSAAVYLTIALLMVRGPGRWGARAGAVVAAAVLIALVGASRVVLGVHYPTDVLAGWCGGLAWALVCRAAYLFSGDRRPRPADAGQSG